MKYFIFRACWSQTDQEIFIVEAYNKSLAEERVNNSVMNPHHWDYIGMSESRILKV